MFLNFPIEWIMQSGEDNRRGDDSAVFSVLHRLNVFRLFTNCMNQNLRLLVTGEKIIYYNYFSNT